MYYDVFPTIRGKLVLKSDILYLNSSTDVIIDCSVSQRFFVNLTQNINVHVINPYDGAEVKVCFAQDTTGGRVINNYYFTNHNGISSVTDTTIIKWKDEQPLILSLSANKWDFVEFRYLNGKYCGIPVDNF